MIKGFRDFISKGNVIDLAVAVVIGAAFGAIVTAIVADLINPLIAAIFNSGDLANSLVVPLPGGTTTTNPDGTTTFVQNGIKFGAIIAAIISFLAIALVVYLVFVYPMNKLKELQAARKAPAEEEPAGPTTEALLTEIRDLLAKQ